MMSGAHSCSAGGAASGRIFGLSLELMIWRILVQEEIYYVCGVRGGWSTVLRCGL